MLLRSAVFVSLITAASCAAVPIRKLTARPVNNTASLWPWVGDEHTTESYVATTDDAWAMVELDFPVTLFNKTSRVVYLNMNGILSLDEPNIDVPTLPEQPLPVDPARCNGKGCLPGTSVALLWKDLAMRPKTDNSVYVLYDPGHEGLQMPHYHIGWYLCDKAVAYIGKSPCGKATRFFQAIIPKDIPGTLFLFHTFFEIIDADQVTGVVGLQSYPDYLSVPIRDIYRSGRACTQTTIDTVARTVKDSTPNWCLGKDSS
ncbi:hypothetical protein Dda_5047 [Drechslerella dactyloides]|uniref:Uncharacterized protein n=1 Tax=Drechslerella dactyloides TaxID=74499 RepID=A0AAD6NIH9_DREDA|nr:hypothetical protein Dda_5047 [Drechslerella dactyloides]